MNHELGQFSVKLIIDYCKSTKTLLIIATHDPKVAVLLDSVIKIFDGYVSHSGKYYPEMLDSGLERKSYTNYYFPNSPLMLPENILSNLSEQSISIINNQKSIIINKGVKKD